MNNKRTIIRRIAAYLIVKFPFLYRSYAALHHNKKMIQQTGETITIFSDFLSELRAVNAKMIGEEIIEKYDSEKKSVLLISHEFSLTGAPLVLINMAKKLKAIGFQVIVISPREEHFFDKGYDTAILSEIPFVLCESLYESDLVLRSANMFNYIVTNTIFTSPIIRMLNNTNHSVVWWIHEALVNYGSRPAKSMPMTLGDNVRVYAVGPYAKKALSIRYPKYRIDELIYYSPDVSTFAVTDDVIVRHQKKRVYAHIGYLGQRKGTDIFLKSISLLPKEMISSCLFVIAGDYSDEATRRKAEKMKRRYPNNIVCTGLLTHKKVYQLLKEIDYLICPSRDDPMPVVIAEGMSAGVPCICSENTGAADFIKKYKAGFVYSGNNPKKLAAEIRRSFNTYRDDYKKLSYSSKAVYERVFSEDVFDRKIRDILKP